MRHAPALLVALFLASPLSALLEAPGGSPRVGSDSCPATAALSCLFPTQDSGSTTSANNTVGQLAGGCQGLTSVPGPDVIYKITIGNQDVLYPSFQVIPSAGYDVALYLLSSAAPGCPIGTGNSVTNCVAAANSGGPGAVESIPLTLGLPFGEYYLFVDSPVASGAASSGSYQIFLNKLCPAELTEYTIE